MAVFQGDGVTQVRGELASQTVRRVQFEVALLGPDSMVTRFRWYVSMKRNYFATSKNF